LSCAVIACLVTGGLPGSQYFNGEDPRFFRITAAPARHGQQNDRQPAGLLDQAANNLLHVAPPADDAYTPYASNATGSLRGCVDRDQFEGCVQLLDAGVQV
jgi:hypothetical protein